MNLRDGAWKNPVIIKEIRTRMRARRAFIILTIHLLILTLIIGLTYAFIFASASPMTRLDEMRTFGKAVFGILVGVELIIVSFIAPALTASSISSERERQTYDLLKVTLLKSSDLIMGKFSSAIIFLILLIFTALPVYGPALMFGGVTTQELIVAILIICSAVTFFSALGIFLSSFASRTLIPTVLAYAVTIFIVFGIPLIIILSLALLGDAIFANNLTQYSTTSRLIFIIIGWIILSISPLSTIISSEAFFLDQQSTLWATIEISETISLRFPSTWIIFLGTYTLLTLIMLLISIRMVSRIEK